MPERAGAGLGAPGIDLKAQRAYLVALGHVPRLGPVGLGRLARRFGSLESAWRAPLDALESTVGASVAARIQETRRKLDPCDALARATAGGARVLTPGDDLWPPALTELSRMPWALYVQGDPALLARSSIAVVGTRACTDYGLSTTWRITRDLVVEGGLAIVSGLALGIDAAAHRAALEHDGATVAVLGNGLDVYYPPGNRHLQAEIAERGAVVSAFPPRAAPLRGNFPARNRIVSGLSLATLVVEAGERSGALITAACAADQGRDVFAVPGRIDGPASEGANALLASGAGLVTRARDILDALGIPDGGLPPVGTAAQGAPGEGVEDPPPPDLRQARIRRLLESGPAHIDDIGRETGLSPAAVAETLAVMELTGRARHLGGMRWSREPAAAYAGKTTPVARLRGGDRDHKPEDTE